MASKNNSKLPISIENNISSKKPKSDENMETENSEFELDTDKIHINHKNLINTNNNLPNTNINYDQITIKNFVRSDKGPYYLMVIKEKINIVEIGKELKNKRLKFENIIHVGKNRVRIELKEYSDANKIINHDEMKTKYKIYIPQMYVVTIGVIKGVPTNMQNDEILKSIESDANILKIERMKAWDSEKKSEYVTESIKIHFRSNTLPNRILLYGALLRVEYFIPNVLYCKNCLNYGHFKKRCTKSTPTCPNCAEDITEKDNHKCSGKPKCKHCEEEHKTNDKNCKERKLQVEIKKYMTKNKTSFFEAKKALNYYQRKKEFKFNQKHFPDTFANKVSTNIREEPKNIQPTKIDNIQSKKTDDVNNSSNDKKFIDFVLQKLSHYRQGSSGNDLILIDLLAYTKTNFSK